MLIEIPEEKLEEARKSFKNQRRIFNKIQIFASKYALNRCKEDMNELSKLGVFCVELNYWIYGENFSTIDFWMDVIPREDMREIRKRNYKLNEFIYHSHLFFEIPVVNMFTEEQIKKWQDYCLRTLAKTAIFNKKKAAQWLKIKNLSSDFD